MFDERKVPEVQQEKLWKHYYDTLSKGVDVGYSPELEEYNPELARTLKHDIAKFSAFKETSFSKQLEGMLTKNGSIVPWSDFKQEALRVSGLYNVNWLQTEYHQTVATANMAGKWDDFQNNKELYPNLKYVAVIDDRTRDEHRRLDGFVAPIDHPIWKKIYPPNDWGCRCDAVQTDDPVSKDLPEDKNKEAFNNNAAISGKVFNEIPYEVGMSADDKQEAQNLARKMFTTESTKLRAKRYDAIPFKKIDNIKNKGELEIFTAGKQNKKESAKNKKALTILANKGHKYRMLPLIEDGMTNPDGFNKLKNRFVDVKVSQGTNGKNIMQSALKEASRQEAQEVVIHLTKKPDSYRQMYESLRNSIKQNRNKNVQHVTIIYPDNTVKQYPIEAIRSKIDKGKTSN